MNIGKLLQDNQIFCQIAPSISRQELLEKLVEPLYENGTVTDKKAFLDAIERREQEMPTQTNSGIALPHACHNSVNKLGLVIATLAENGIEYAEGMECNCKLLFLICIPENTPAAHIPLYSFIADFVTNSNKLDELIACTSVEQVRNLLENWPQNK